jgi:hypothetical protein
MAGSSTSYVVHRIVDTLQRVVRRVGLVWDPTFVAELGEVAVVTEEIVYPLLKRGEVRR